MITPLPGYLLVELIDSENKTSVGIHLPQAENEGIMQGKVIARSPIVPYDSQDALLLENDALWSKELKRIQKGTIVLFRKHTHHELSAYEEPNLALGEYKYLMGIKTEEEQ